MEVFWRLVLGHLISDFTLQTNYIAAWKRRSPWGLFVHAATHVVIYSILLWKYLGQVWIQVGPIELTGCWCILTLFTAHIIEDGWRIWSVQKRGAPDNTFFYFWDQMIHYAFIFALSPVVDGGMVSTSKFGFFHYPPLQGVLSGAAAGALPWWERLLTLSRPEPWVFIGIVYAVVTHFTTVTIYFLEKDFLGTEFPEVQEKYLSMAERVVVTGCFLLPGSWWVLVFAVWLLRLLSYKLMRVYDFTWISFAAGNSIAVLCGIFLRTIIY